MKIKFPLLFLAALFFIIGCFGYFSDPPAVVDVFKAGGGDVKISGTAYIYTTPRGAPRIKIIGRNGALYYIDCLTNTHFCAGNKLSENVVDAELVLIKNKFYWPTRVRFGSGFDLSREQSIMMYEIYLDREKSMHSFWFLISAAFVVFSFWFGNRSLLNASQRSKS